MLLLAGCAGLLGPREVKLPLSKLQSSLDQRFPFTQRYLEVFDVAVERPKLSLKPEENRIQLDLNLIISPLFSNKRLNAGLILSAGLMVDPSRQGLMLVAPKVEQLRVDGVEANSRFSKLGSFIVDRIFKDKPLHRYKEEDLRFAGVQFVPVGVAIREQELVINLEPVK
jgi:hypothetical protein